jgi:hypothetical protein
MDNPAIPTPADQIPEELTSAAPDYLEDENGEVLTNDDGTPWLELA